MDDLDLIDTKALLESLEIEYSDKGENTTSGWVNITCPFCGDHMNHCGINTETNLFHCWICSEKGDIIKLIREIKNISYRHAERLANNYLMDVGTLYRSEEEKQSYDKCNQEKIPFLSYPKPIFTSAPEPHRKYLESRNFDPDFLTRKYKLKFTFNTGDYRFRIIAPITFDGKEVSWIAADVIRKEAIPYIKCPKEQSIISANDCLYNIDTAGEAVFLVEGITDVWRCGDGFVASMTKNINSAQIQQLIDKNIKKVFVMYDSDAVIGAKKTANKLSGLFKTEVIELSDGDPADLSKEEVTEIRKLLK